MDKDLLYIYNDIKTKLSNAGVDSPAFESFVIFQEVFGKRYIDCDDIDITDEKVKLLNDIIKKRQQRYPLQYILGMWEFWGLKFKVGKGVLIPRKETEFLVEVALKEIEKKTKPIIIDLCSGSGCVAISLAKERPDATVYAIEKSKEAFQYLSYNILINETDNVKPILGDVFRINFNIDLVFDLIVSNPPYIRYGEIKNLQQEITYEPRLALNGGVDGLYFYRKITQKWVKKLKNDSVLAFEVGVNQYKDILNIMKKYGFTDLKLKKDFSGIYRIVYGKTKL